MANLKFVNINKVYDNNVQAVFDFNLDVKDKEFIVFVGPSGCGKSTTLRMLAGLEQITAGELYIDDVLINDVEAKDRDIAMVFQNYALYPHMTVYRNMAFALELKKVKKEEIDARVKEAAEILGLKDYLDRKPKALSGGQRQRVALGRAIVRKPKVFLMDEPLSNLDAKLRVQMRMEIIKIHERVGATTIYVTHDQTEAMTMADRIVVMKDGHIQQVGTPKELYEHPANVFVAGFIGSPATNFINCTFLNGELYVEGSEIKINLSEKQKEAIVKSAKEEGKQLPYLFEKYSSYLTRAEEMLANKKIKKKAKKKINIESLKEDIKQIEDRIAEVNKFNEEHKRLKVILGIRPEHLIVEKAKTSKEVNHFHLTIDASELLGNEAIIYSFINNQKIIIKTSNMLEIKNGQKLNISLDEEHIRLFNPLTGEAIK